MEHIDLQSFTATTAPIGTVLLGVSTVGVAHFTSHAYDVSIAFTTHSDAVAFVDGYGRHPLRLEIDGSGDRWIVYVNLGTTHDDEDVNALMGFVRYAIAQGLTPAARILPAERRFSDFTYAELEDVRAAYAGALSATEVSA